MKIFKLLSFEEQIKLINTSKAWRELALSDIHDMVDKGEHS
ncbi:hypothetical protein [Legionella tunisiensis]